MTTAVSMIARFAGEAGRAKLIEALLQQEIVSGDRGLAERLAAAGTLVPFEVDDIICEQGGTDDDVYFLLDGSVAVLVNRQRLTVRTAGTIVGEMAAIDPTERRSTTLKGAAAVVALKLSAVDFNEVGKESATFWRYLARLAGDRLRERSKFHLPANATPIMFVGSSVEGLPVAREIEAALKHDSVIVRLWTTSGVFGPGGVPIESLLQQVEQADFALFVFGPDDQIQSRDEAHAAPRDNVVFELGLFMGRLGRDRVFMVKDQDIELKIPSDLTGVSPITYKCKPGCTPSDIVGTVSTDLRKAITSRGVVTHRMKVLP